MIIAHFPLFLNSKGYEKYNSRKLDKTEILGLTNDWDMAGGHLQKLLSCLFIFRFLRKKSFQKASVSLFDNSCFQVVRPKSTTQLQNAILTLF